MRGPPLGLGQEEEAMSMEERSAEKLRVCQERTGEEIDKRFGTGAVQTADHLGGAVIRTGSLALDVATGIGGLPRGRIVEFYGPEGAGKTALALCAIAEAQRAGGVCAFIDADQSIDPGWARKLGVRLDQLLVSQPENGNAALQIVETLIHTGVIDLVVVDSVPGLVPKVELDDEVGELYLEHDLRLMDQAVRRLVRIAAKHDTTVLFTNQLRDKVGVVFGNPEETVGGRALRHFASLRVDLRRSGAVTVGGRSVGTRIKASVVKSKMAPPWREAMLVLRFDEAAGPCPVHDLITLGAGVGLVQVLAGGYSIDGGKITGDEEKIRAWFRDQPLASANLLADLRERLLPKA